LERFSFGGEPGGELPLVSELSVGILKGLFGCFEGGGVPFSWRHGVHLILKGGFFLSERIGFVGLIGEFAIGFAKACFVCSKAFGVVGGRQANLLLADRDFEEVFSFLEGFDLILGFGEFVRSMAAGWAEKDSLSFDSRMIFDCNW